MAEHSARPIYLGFPGYRSRQALSFDRTINIYALICDREFATFPSPPFKQEKPNFGATRRVQPLLPSTACVFLGLTYEKSYRSLLIKSASSFSFTPPQTT
jgi:hypothetical protein